MDRVEEAQLALDLAKLELAVQTTRRDFGDDLIEATDIAAIAQCACFFGVTRRAAYFRAKSLGLLSYQARKDGGIDAALSEGTS